MFGNNRPMFGGSNLSFGSNTSSFGGQQSQQPNSLLEIAITTTIPPVTMPNQDLVDSLLPLAVIVTVYLEITILKIMGHLASQWVPPKTHHLGR